MAFHAPDVVEEPAGKTQEPRTPLSPNFLSSLPNFVFLLGLTSARGRLGWCTLCTLLADLASGLALGGLGGGLSLVGLLGGGGGLLLLLGVLDGGGAGGVAGLRALSAALLDHIEGGTNDGTLGLDGSAGALLGNFL